MLKRLEIQNYAIIDHLEINFPSGLTIITGETGAGKSIVLGALGLIMGKRADTKVLYDQERKCMVEAIFDIQDYQLEAFFTTMSLDYSDELIIRREIAPGGKSRAFINDTPVTLEILTALTEGLINVHQQFDMLDIQKPAFQMQVIDALSGNKTLLDKYVEKYKIFRHAIKKLEELEEKSRLANQETEFLSFQMNEFTVAELQEHEQSSLEVLLHKLTSAEDIKKNTALLVHALEENENSIISQLQALIIQFASIRQLDQTYYDLYSRLLSVKEELADVAKEASNMSEATDFDEEAIHNATNRLNVINRLQKKHNVHSMSELMAVQNGIQLKLDAYTDIAIEIASLNKECQLKNDELQVIALELREQRKKIIPSFEKNVHELLLGLSMEHAYIKVKFLEVMNFNANGLDDVSILFAPNKGSDFLPLKDTASGGEISRLTLCIKSLIAGAVTLPTLVFDEIDAGVSGEVAQKMGVILSDLSKRHQIISITHSPQIASKAHSHFWVYKTDTASRTVTSMKELSMEERVTEIAKMLSGNPPTQAARANALELIGST